MKYYLWILGCAMNYSDAERIATVMDLTGYKRTDKEAEADIIITVACSVRQHAIDRIYGKLNNWKKIKRKRPLVTILSGCVLAADKKKMGETFDYMFEIDNLGSLPEFLKQDKGEKKEIRDYLQVHPAYSSSFQAYVPIMTGCNNFCTYCAVPFTRGREKSRKKEEIVREVASLIHRGYKEITLLGQNVNSYRDGFSDLLTEIDKIEGEYRVYFYSNHPKDMTDKIIKTIAALKHFPRYIHLPLQSGNNRIIKKMNRHYTKEEYLKLVRKIRKAMPEVTLTTDIIVGFPGETEKEFASTAEVMKKAKFEMAFLAQYSPRPGTMAAKLADDVEKKEKARRERVLTEILGENSLRENNKLLGKSLRVLVDKKKNGKYYGRTDSYKVVEIKTDRKDLIGQFVMVKIEKAESWKLIGSFFTIPS